MAELRAVLVSNVLFFRYQNNVEEFYVYRLQGQIRQNVGNIMGQCHKLADVTVFFLWLVADYGWGQYTDVTRKKAACSCHLHTGCYAVTISGVPASVLARVNVEKFCIWSQVLVFVVPTIIVSALHNTSVLLLLTLGYSFINVLYPQH